VSYIIIIVVGKWIFRERIDGWKIAAIVLILAGVVALGFSEPARGKLGTATIFSPRGEKMVAVPSFPGGVR
jgi:drug/metabolite transporter (DMT)-like permease